MNHPALDFLAVLDPDPIATFNIEAFSDLPKGADRPKPDPLLQRYPEKTADEVAALLPELTKLNSEGAAIYVAVNQCQGQRTKAAISRVRGLHADFDEASEDDLASLRAPLPPTLEVQSSTSNNRHMYWLLQDGERLAAEDAEQLNKGLVRWGADRAATDVSRLLRLPGFDNRKSCIGNAYPTVTMVSHGPRYSVAQLRRVIEVEQDSTPGETGVETEPVQHPPIDKGLTDLGWELAIGSIQSIAPHLWRGDWQHPKASARPGGFGSQSEADLALAGLIARELNRPGLSAHDLAVQVEEIFSQSGLANRAKWRDRADYRERTVAMAVEGAQSGASNPDPDPQDDARGDIANGRAFAAKWRDRMLYNADSGQWLQWTEGRWMTCCQGESTEAAKAVACEMLADAGKALATDPDRGTRLVVAAANTHQLPRLKAMIELARSEPGMSVRASELDANPHLLGTENGVVDLRHATLSANTPDQRITKQCRAAFVAGAPCSRWMQFLDEVFAADVETIATVQQLLGYSLVGTSREELFVFCVGRGANGKSIFGNVVQRILGDYAKTAAPSLLTTRRADGPTNDLAALAGCRLVSLNELESGAQLSPQTVKMVAGREPITARYLYRDFFELIPTFTPWLRTNHPPIIKDDDDGIWRRIVVLPFNRTFARHEQETNLEERLWAERDGILAWMVEGARQYLAHGITFSPAIERERQAYRSESDILAEFLDDKTRRDPNGRIEQSALYSRWRYWCDENGVQAASKNSFTRRLADRGFGSAKSNGKRFYTGLTDARTEPQGGKGVFSSISTKPNKETVQ